jgi:hypothetical protein
MMVQQWAGAWRGMLNPLPLFSLALGADGEVSSYDSFEVKYAYSPV